MSHDLFSSLASFDSSTSSVLLVRDVAGDYRQVDADEVLQAAQQVLLSRVRGSDVLASPQAVRDFLRVKLGTLEHEVFAVVHLDTQNRVIEYVEMFRGTVSQTSVYPREVVKRAGDQAAHEGELRRGLLFALRGAPGGAPRGLEARDDRLHRVRRFDQSVTSVN